MNEEYAINNFRLYFVYLLEYIVYAVVHFLYDILCKVNLYLIFSSKTVYDVFKHMSSLSLLKNFLFNLRLC